MDLKNIPLIGKLFGDKASEPEVDAYGPFKGMTPDQILESIRDNVKSELGFSDEQVAVAEEVLTEVYRAEAIHMQQTEFSFHEAGRVNRSDIERILEEEPDLSDSLKENGISVQEFVQFNSMLPNQMRSHLQQDIPEVVKHDDLANG